MRRAAILLLITIALIQPATAQDPQPAPAEITWTQEADALLLEAREPRPCLPDSELPCERLWRIYGDGRIELLPGPAWMKGGVSIAPEVVEQLLLELDQLSDLPTRESVDPPPEKGPYLRVFLKRYRSADWSVAKDYLATLEVDELDPVFSHLRAVLRWLSYREQAIVFRSGHPWPEICRTKRRMELGIHSEPPVWCVDLMQRSGLTFRGAGGRIESDESSPFSSADRDRIRERLRERLQSLPRSPPPL